MKKLNSQPGRFMVEMLGVFAIIGVLLVGGIVGYSLFMRRHRANAVIDAALNYGNCQQKILNGEIEGNPSGVVSIRNGAVEMNPTGIDKVSTCVTLSDQKLCQAVASITGGSCQQRVPGEHIIVVTINQNSKEKSNEKT